MKNSRTGPRRLAVEVDRGAPGRLVAVGEGLRRDRVQVGALRAEVVVDHVEQHHQPARVGRVDQRLEVLRPAVAAVGRVGQHAVVAPVPRAREIGDRHELDRGHAQCHQMVELVDRGAEGALRREGADVQFVDDRLLPGAAAPAVVAPGDRPPGRSPRSGRARRPAGSATPGPAPGSRRAARSGSGCRHGPGPSPAHASHRPLPSSPAVHRRLQLRRLPRLCRQRR